MAGHIASLLRPNVRRAPSTAAGGNFSTASRAVPRSGAPEEMSETEVYLRRSYALVEQLRQAVAERSRAGR